MASILMPSFMRIGEETQKDEWRRMTTISD
jgi:hypothetical protein